MRPRKDLDDRTEVPIRVFVTRSQLSEIDKTRGDVPRSAWIRRAVTEKLENLRLDSRLIQTVRDL